jgi:hypothetical protein
LPLGFFYLFWDTRSQRNNVPWEIWKIVQIFSREWHNKQSGTSATWTWQIMQYQANIRHSSWKMFHQKFISSKLVNK